MADTPRVTVPVEDLAGKLKAIRDKFLMPTPDKDFTDYAIMTRCVEALSAAPAPEGVAVDARTVAKILNPALFSHDKVEAHRAASPHTVTSARIDAVDDVRRVLDAVALATREAEAGEDAIKAACIAWHRAKGSDPFNVLYNGAWCGSFPHQTGPERWTFTVPAMKEAIAAYLRARPQAREDGGDRPIEASWTDGVTHAYVNLSAALSAERQAWRQKLGLRIASVRYLDVEVPPAREDAQPVAKVVRLGFSKGGISFTSAGNEADLPDGTPLFTHPAPDALREAVALLERWYATRSEMSGAGTVETETRQFIATLQAEQKGGAVDGPEDDELPGDFLARVGMDGALWADGFRKMALKLGYSDMDEGWLIGWFCNAVMAGYDHAQRRFDPALATREEAPAELLSDPQQLEAVAEAIKSACVAWHEARGENPFNVLYHGAWCGSFPHQTGPERWTFTVPAMEKAIAAYLRAQPPAREDAQPVAKVVSAHGDPEAFGEREIEVLQDLKRIPYNTLLYTHPTPDALRAAVEALEPFARAARGLSSRWADHQTHWQGATSPIAVEDLRRADQALAALQAEQGAK